jgi:ATP adenylyltransferase
MIAPYKHLSLFERAKKESTDELADLLKLSLKVLRKKYCPQGFNTGMNLGKCAGAGVADHYHLHVIPRWTGDDDRKSRNDIRPALSPFSWGKIRFIKN